MRAVIQESYGPIESLHVREVPEPVVESGHVLVRVRAASVHPDVWHAVTGQPSVLRLMGGGVRRPRVRIPGTDMAGEVVDVGGAGTGFEPGEMVFGETIGVNQWRNGAAFAEYVSVAPEALARKPGNVTFEQAATVPTAGLIALRNLPSTHLRAGAQVLVNGAAGGVGSLVVQIARSAGAHVSGVDVATKLDLVREMGADRALDAAEDVTRGAERYDLVVDIPGNHSFAAWRRVLKPDGLWVFIGHDQFGAGGRRWLGGVPRMLGLMARTPFSAQLPSASGFAIGRQEAMTRLADLLADGGIRPVVDRAYPLAQAGAAIRHLTDGTARGRIVLTV